MQKFRVLQQVMLLSDYIENYKPFLVLQQTTLHVAWKFIQNFE